MTTLPVMKRLKWDPWFKMYFVIVFQELPDGSEHFIGERHVTPQDRIDFGMDGEEGNDCS